MHHVLLLPRLDLCVPKLGDCWREPILGIPRGVTLPPIIMEVRKHGSLPIVVPFQIQTLFHFHDCGRKSSSGKQRARFPEKNNLEKTVVSRTLLFPNQPFFGGFYIYLRKQVKWVIFTFFWGVKRRQQTNMKIPWDQHEITFDQLILRSSFSCTCQCQINILEDTLKVPKVYIYIPSRKLTYPTWGKGKSSSKETFYGIC